MKILETEYNLADIESGFLVSQQVKLSQHFVYVHSLYILCLEMNSVGVDIALKHRQQKWVSELLQNFFLVDDMFAHVEFVYLIKCDGFQSVKLIWQLFANDLTNKSKLALAESFDKHHVF